jgi:hypothetical protein
MGGTCSKSCQGVESDGHGLGRADSPDPIMYDLMHKSIQATTARLDSTETTDKNTTTMAATTITKRKSAGQHHLLFRNAKSDGVIVAANKPLMDGAAWLPEDTPIPCPTRLLIRRRSPRVPDESVGTHIYAIRYPEGIANNVISEQAAPRPESARQEQYPTKNCSFSLQLGETLGPKTITTVPGDSGKAAGPQRLRALDGALSEGTDIYSRIAMATKPSLQGMCVTLEFILVQNGTDSGIRRFVLLFLSSLARSRPIT